MPPVEVSAASTSAVPANPPVPTGPSRLLRSLAQVREVVLLGRAALVALVTPPFVWRREFVYQGWSLVRRAWFPLGLSALIFGYGAAGVQAAAFTESIGAVERTGLVGSFGTIREIAVWVTGMLVAGVAGTAITADLGARKIRQELDAMGVMGVDVVRRLVAPRVLALTVLMPALGMVAMVACIIGALFAALQFGGTAAGFWAVFTNSVNVVDDLAFVVKTTVFGLVVGIVCSYKGINASGGSQGVGRAVNQAVVISFVAVWIINYAFNSTYLAIFPDISGTR